MPSAGDVKKQKGEATNPLGGLVRMLSGPGERPSSFLACLFLQVREARRIGRLRFSVNVMLPILRFAQNGKEPTLLATNRQGA